MERQKVQEKIDASRRTNALKRYEKIRREFERLYNKEKLRKDYCLEILSEKFFLSTSRLKKIIGKPSTTENDSRLK